jgi:hypothetical protein
VEEVGNQRKVLHAEALGDTSILHLKPVNNKITKLVENNYLQRTTKTI